MNEFDQSEVLTQILEPSTAKTAELPRVLPGSTKGDGDFAVGQGQVLAMIAANAPLSDILKRLVLLIEAQAPGMLCSVLLLSDDGDHVRHGAAPSLSEDYVKAIDGAPIGPKHGSCGTAMYGAVSVGPIFVNPLGDYREKHGERLCAPLVTPILSVRGKVLGHCQYYLQAAYAGG